VQQRIVRGRSLYMQNSKILLANNNPTIQKVVEITFKRESASLFFAKDYAEIFEKIKSENFDLVIMDSKIVASIERLPEIAAKIKKEIPTTKILLLTASSESITHLLVNNSAIDGHIIRPFESKDFIKKCNTLLSSTKLANGINQSQNQEADLQHEGNDMQNNLLAEASEWTIPVPSIIGHNNEITTPIPEIIASASAYETTTDKNIEIIKEEDEEKSKNKTEAENENEEDDDRPTNPIIMRPSIQEIKTEDRQSDILSKLTPLDDLLLDDTDGPSPELEDMAPSHKHTAQIDLSDEISSQEFWENGPKTANKLNNTDEKTNSTTTVETKKSPTQNIEEISEKLKADLTPIIEAYVKQYCQEIVEKVAWEVIPDLAENLIKKELSSLADSVD